MEEMNVQQGTTNKAKGLTTRQHRLKDWLDENFQQGKFFTIEEVVRGVVDSDGNPYYKLNHSPKVHDKCIALSQDVRQINFNVTDRYIPIIKDKYGSIKLAENKDEVETFVNVMKKKVENLCMYYNTIIYKTNLDGIIPLINLGGRVLTLDEMKPIEAMKRTDNE